jgi:hypothetical protein
MKVWILPLLLLAVFTIWLISGVLLTNYPNRGTFGDMFGAVNSLFSGLAFAGLIYTIFLQKNELGLQRKELEMTRDEIRGQRETLEAQNAHMSHQNFEGTFFQMLRLHNDLLNSIDLTSGGTADMPVKIISGRDCFMTAWRRFKQKFQLGMESSNKVEREKEIDEAFAKLWRIYEGEFGHYYRSLYNVLKFINNSNAEDKKHYTNIVRAQLSGQELLIMLYNCIYHKESKLTVLINKYALLKHIPHHVVGKLDLEFYEPAAFGGEYPHNKPIKQD